MGGPDPPRLPAGSPEELGVEDGGEGVGEEGGVATVASFCGPPRVAATARQRATTTAVEGAMRGAGVAPLAGS
jgi:hypothetical protein